MRRSSGAIALLPDEEDKSATHGLAGDGFSWLPGNDVQELGIGGSNGDGEASPFVQLLEQSGGNLGSRGGHDDGVERAAGGETQTAVSDMNGDVGVAELFEDSLGAGGQRGVALDGIDMAAEFGEQRGLVAGA